VVLVFLCLFCLGFGLVCGCGFFGLFLGWFLVLLVVGLWGVWLWLGLMLVVGVGDVVVEGCVGCFICVVLLGVYDWFFCCEKMGGLLCGCYCLGIIVR